VQSIITTTLAALLVLTAIPSLAAAQPDPQPAPPPVPPPAALTAPSAPATPPPPPAPIAGPAGPATEPAALPPFPFGGPPLQPVVPEKPLLSLGRGLYFVKPIIQMAAGLYYDYPVEGANTNREARVTTVAITRFGFEGRLGPYVTFRSEFEKNLGAHGTGIWEGTASFSVRDQEIRLSRWGLTLAGGIVTDDASIDYISLNVGDLLYADKYTRNPLLYSGFNRGQGLLASLARYGFKLQLSYTEANPLSSSASFQIGGAFAGGSHFWEKPLANYRNGQPDDDFHFRVISPSLSFTSKYIEAKGMGQFFDIDYATQQKGTPHLRGYNVRGNLLAKIPFRAAGLPVLVTAFGNVARLQNDVLNQTAGYSDQLLRSSYVSLSLSGGLDILVAERAGLGGYYAVIQDSTPSFIAPSGGKPAFEPVSLSSKSYLNVGLTYWLTPFIAAGARFARYSLAQTNQPTETDMAFMATLRLVL
jgi:hypothetical protein